MRKPKKYFEKFLDILYPPVCINCGQFIENQKDIICKKCFDMISINFSLMCPKCGSRKTSIENTCHNTEFILAPASFYHEPIPALIHNYKYKNIGHAKKLLSAILITYLQNLDIDFKKFYVSYIPLHKRKKRQRGFNQSEKLAKIVSEYLNIPLIKTIEKTKYNKPQAQIKNHTLRADNVKNVFRLSKDIKDMNKNIILVDDICTSGNTLLEASKILKNAGAKKIIGLVVAKAD